ncbi:MAG TPA: acyl-CoA thioesterase [Herpetosiphonaceae bacterium]
MEAAHPHRDITLRFLAEPTEVNFGGKVHGGTVMKWIDHAGYTCAVGWSGRYCVTVYVGGIRFYQPIHIGDLVEVHARLIYTGTTSMHIAVDVSAGAPTDREMRKTTHCIIIFVAVDQDGKPVAVPAWQPQSDADRVLHDYAQKLMALREGIEEQMRQYREQPAERGTQEPRTTS